VPTAGCLSNQAIQLTTPPTCMRSPRPLVCLQLLNPRGATVIALFTLHLA
jgi:hypothetical protein